jgi:hypothetical protein
MSLSYFAKKNFDSCKHSSLFLQKRAFMTKKSFIRFFPGEVLALDLDELDLDEDEEDGKKAPLSIHFQPKKSLQHYSH